MKIKAKRIRLGIFIFMSFLLLVAMIVFFAANQLFEKTDNYYVAYQDISVSGLEVGSPVNYLGIKIGVISDISVDPEDINSIVVKLSVEEGTPLKEDTQADIITLGITGLKAIEIRGGSNDARTLEDGDQINAGNSSTAEITGKANIIAEKTEKVINNLQVFTQPENMKVFTDAAQNINLLAKQLNSTTGKLEAMIEENRADINEAIFTANHITKSLDLSSVALQEVVESINIMIKGDTIQQIIGNANAISNQIRESDLRKLIQNLAEMTAQTGVLLYKFDQELDVNSAELNESLELLRVTLSNLEETTNKINSDPSILFRGLKDKNIPDRRLSK